MTTRRNLASGRIRSLWAFALGVLILLGRQLTAEEPSLPSTPRSLLSQSDWIKLDQAVDRGLQYLAQQQKKGDGSFAAPDLGQPGITSLCVLAFMAKGHVPNEGPYGQALQRAIEFVLKSQRENGLLFSIPAEGPWKYGTASHTAVYNHAAAGLMLSEAYGIVDPALAARISPALTKGVEFTLQLQLRPKRNALDAGGWRYVGSTSHLHSDADLSITSWQLMFLRSARNDGFEIPSKPIDDALEFIRRSYKSGPREFYYGQVSPNDHATRAIVGGGILALALGGEHQTEMAKAAGEWILKHPFDRYNQVEHPEERYHYSAYYCSQAMFQLGGDYWSQFFPHLMRVLLKNQKPDGSWPPEANRDRYFGSSYTTALVVLALTPPYQLLPIYQR